MPAKLSDIQIDAFREATNIGAGHAAMAMSQMLNKKIMISVPKFDVCSKDFFVKSVNEPVSGIYIHALGDVNGAVILMFDKRSSLKFSELLLFRSNGNAKILDQKAESALKEMGSILTGAFFTSLADMLGLKAFHKAPVFTLDKAENIIHNACEQVFGETSQRLCLGTELIEPVNKVSGTFAFVPSSNAMKVIWEKLKIKG